jgi:hypothetical protein
MCEVLWRNISDFYVNLRAPTGNFSNVFFILDKNNERPDSMTDLKHTCYIYSFVWFWNIVDHW